MYKRMGFSMLKQSPPLEFIEPIGHGPQFHFTRPQSGDYSSHPSSNSGHACAASPQESDDDDDDDEEDNSDSFSESEESHTQEEKPTARRVEVADFELEEVESGPEYDSETEVVRPDHFEDASSERATEEGLETDTGIISRFSSLHCAGELNDEEQRASYRKKKKRWSAGIFKRSHSQSVGSDTDIEDSEALDAHDVDSSARRLRRRVRGPGENRSSLIFDELPNTNIVEVEEPDDVGSGKGPPSIPSDDGFALDALPFWVLDDPMDVDWDSSRPSSAT